MAYTYVSICEGMEPESYGMPGTLNPHIVSDRSDDSSDEDPRIVQRVTGRRPTGADTHWLEEDFWSLAATNK